MICTGKVRNEPAVAEDEPDPSVAAYSREVALRFLPAPEAAEPSRPPAPAAPIAEAPAEPVVPVPEIQIEEPREQIAHVPDYIEASFNIRHLRRELENPECAEKEAERLQPGLH